MNGEGTLGDMARPARGSVRGTWVCPFPRSWYPQGSPCSMSDETVTGEPQRPWVTPPGATDSPVDPGSEEAPWTGTLSPGGLPSSWRLRIKIALMLGAIVVAVGTYLYFSRGPGQTVVVVQTGRRPR